MLQMGEEGIQLTIATVTPIPGTCCTDETCRPRRNTRNLYILQELDEYLTEAHKDFTSYERKIKHAKSASKD